MERGLKMKKIDLEIDRGIQTAIENQHREFLKKEMERKKREQKKRKSYLNLYRYIYCCISRNSITSK